jgi:hypothetical protein
MNGHQATPRAYTSFKLKMVGSTVRLSVKGHVHDNRGKLQIYSEIRYAQISYTLTSLLHAFRPQDIGPNRWQDQSAHFLLIQLVSLALARKHVHEQVL